jgi:3-oxoacyl-[acyl-carrier-protein] synthase II
MGGAVRGAPRAFVTGMGCVGPHGIGVAAYHAGLRAGRTATRTITLFSADELSCRVAAEVPDFDPEAHVARRERGRVARVVPMSVLAAREALTDAGLDPDDLPPELRRALPVLLGSGAGCIEYAERQYASYFAQGARGVSPYAVPCSTPGMLASEVSIALALGGMSHVVSNGCTSSTDALGYALDFVRAGRADILLAGGADACITPGVLAGYCNMKVVSTAWNETPGRSSRPMSADRDGFVLGEGAWVLVIESEAALLKSGRRPLAEVAGYGASCEAYHRVAMREDGVEPARAMHQALHDAELPAEAIDYVNLHGTGTPLNDRVETRAVKRVLADRAARVPMSATKSLVGHPQGASGAAGVVATILAMQSGFVHPTANLDHYDPECDLDYVPNEARRVDIRAALCNCLGFGSKNAALVLRRV